MLITSYHNHSTWSDGWASPEAMYRSAKAAGLKEFGLSDHFVMPPDSGYESESWSMKLDRLEEYVLDSLAWKKQLDDENFTLRLGVEVDYFSENVQEVLAKLKQFPFDYFIGAVHFSGTFPVDHLRDDWENLSQGRIDEIWQGYWDKVKGLIQTRAFDFLAHLDLPKKFNFFPSTDFTSEIDEILALLKENDHAFELNTAGWFKPCEAPYPDLITLQKAAQLGIPVLVNADAHKDEHVARSFPEAEAMLKQAGFSQVCTFCKHERRTIPL